MTVAAYPLVGVFFLATLIALFSPNKANASTQVAVKVKLRNDSGDMVAVHWVHPQTKEPTLMNHVQPNKTYTLNSFLSHEFQVWQVPNEESGLCNGGDNEAAAAAAITNNGECKINYFAVTQRPGQRECFWCCGSCSFLACLLFASGRHASVAGILALVGLNIFFALVFFVSLSVTVIKEGIEIENHVLETDEDDMDIGAALSELSAMRDQVESAKAQQRTGDYLEALVKLGMLDMTQIEEPTVVVTDCKTQALQRMEVLQQQEEPTKGEEELTDAGITSAAVKALRDCMARRLTPSLKRASEEIEFERNLRVDQAAKMENFTCIDPDIVMSPDVRTEDWTIEEVLWNQDDSESKEVQRLNVTRKAHIKHDRPASRIHVVENFASEAECAAMEADAANNLHVASTADGKGGTKVSVGRKAMQAGIRPKFNDDGSPKDGNLIAQLSGRVYDYVNHVFDNSPQSLSISHHGQEPLMSIQYFGRGRNDTEPDRYTPHCDGKCEGRQHDFGSRMATVVIYWYVMGDEMFLSFRMYDDAAVCHGTIYISLTFFFNFNFCSTIPDEGGNTNFNQANVHVKASKGSAIFFSYMDPLSKVMDYGFTTHSGCPVFEGEKKIVTQWVRYGVDKTVTHSSFNTLNILHREAGES